MSNCSIDSESIKVFSTTEKFLEFLLIVDNLEIQYNRAKDLNAPKNTRLKLNMYLLSVAINVLDYPSRLDKYDMEIINDVSQVKDDKSYVLLTDPITFIFQNDKKHHKPITYKLNAKPLQQLNKRLKKLIYQSLTDFPRNHLFISPTTEKPVKETTVAEWLSDLVPNKI